MTEQGKKLKLRKGDLIRDRFGNVGLITTTRGRSLGKGKIEILQPNKFVEIDRQDVVVIRQRRENLKDWWKYL